MTADALEGDFPPFFLKKKKKKMKKEEVELLANHLSSM